MNGCIVARTAAIQPVERSIFRHTYLWFIAKLIDGMALGLGERRAPEARSRVADDGIPATG